MSLTLGFIGLGRMGLAMAQRLRQHGFDVIGCDLSPGACTAFITVGGRIAPTPRAVAEEAHVVFACLPSAQACRDAAFGSSGVVRGSARLYVECSTIGPQAVREIAQRLAHAGIAVIDCPVSGDPSAAAAGALSAIVAGSADSVELVHEAISAFAQTIVQAGTEPGVAQVFKLVSETLTHAAFVLTAEAVTAAVKAGADPATLLAYLNNGPARNWATAVQYPRAVLPRHFGEGDLAVVRKDLELYLDMCRQGGIPAAMAQQAEVAMTFADTVLPQPVDLASVALLYERAAGVEVVAAPVAAPVDGDTQPETTADTTLTATDGHAFGAYVARPLQAANAAVVVLHEVFGVNDHIRVICDRLASEGYLAIAPALYDRAERGGTRHFGPDESIVGSVVSREVSDQQAMKDVAAAVFRAAAELGPEGNVGVLGFCWGGTLAWLCAASLPVSAAVSYYGSGIPDYLGEAPQAPVLLHFGARDEYISSQQVARIEAAYPRVPLFHYDAGYGFNSVDQAGYEPDCARLAWKRTLNFLAERLR